MADKLKENLMDNITTVVNFDTADANITKLQNDINKILDENKITEKKCSVFSNSRY